MVLGSTSASWAGLESFFFLSTSSRSSLADGTCVDPADGTGAVYLRFAGHARTALRDPVPDDGAIGSKETSSLSCITQVRYENHYSHGGLREFQVRALAPSSCFEGRGELTSSLLIN